MDVVEWLLAGDPSIRWQVMRDLQGVDADLVVKERAKVETEGWGARLLSFEDSDGQWGGGAYTPSDYDPQEPGQAWTGTMHTLQTLQLLGLEPSSGSAKRAVAGIAANSRWRDGDRPYFEGETEPCINGRLVESGAYFGVNVDQVVDRLMSEQLDDGGWNCEAPTNSLTTSFDTTINVLEGLLAWEQVSGGSLEVNAVRRGAEEYFLERSLFRRKATGEVAQQDFVEFAFPYYWQYDGLRGLEYFRMAGGVPDQRLTEAVELVRSKRQPDGRWLLDRVPEGRTYFDIETPVGTPSRWNTLRALRVLKWWDSGGVPTS